MVVAQVKDCYIVKDCLPWCVVEASKNSTSTMSFWTRIREATNYCASFVRCMYVKG
jgi:hypothetical protein